MKYLEEVVCLSSLRSSSIQEIVYKKTDEWYIEWQRLTTSGITSDNEWYNELQRMTASDKEWQRVTTSDDEWQRMTTSDNEWQRVTTSDYFG